MRLTGTTGPEDFEVTIGTFTAPYGAGWRTEVIAERDVYFKVHARDVLILMGCFTLYFIALAAVCLLLARLGRKNGNNS